jgi:hypothetical protein
MKIFQYITVRGRGVLAIVDALPSELKIGMYVRGTIFSPYADWRWKVCGIETHAIERRDRPDMKGGLLLQGEYPLPAVGDELEVVP